MALNPGSPALSAGESKTTQPKQSGKSLSSSAKIPESGEHKPRRRDAGEGDPGEGAPGGSAPPVFCRSHAPGR